MAKYLNDVEVGSLVKINENGIPTEFYVACHDYESELNGTGKTLVVRKDCYDKRAWHSSKVNAYKTSTINTWLNVDYLSLLDDSLQKAIPYTDFYYTTGQGNSTVNTMSSKVFLLSRTELDCYAGDATIEGSVLPIASTLQIAYLDDVAFPQWVRTPYVGRTDLVCSVSAKGTVDHGYATDTFGSRPAFTLPADSTLILADGTVWFEKVTDFGEKPHDFSVDYATTLSGDNITLTEYTDNNFMRSYTTAEGITQTASVAVNDLQTGTHFFVVFAESDTAKETLVYKFIVPVVHIDYHGDIWLGTKTSDFDLPFTVGAHSGNDVTVTEYVNGAVQDNYVVASGTNLMRRVSLERAVDGFGEVTIVAKSDGDTTTLKLQFNVPPLSIHSGGTIQELQDGVGNPIFPVTLGRAVITEDGESLERKLLNSIDNSVTKNTYAWKVSQPLNVPYVISDTAAPVRVAYTHADNAYGGGGAWSVQYSDKIEVSADGTLSLVNPTSTTFSMSDETSPNILKGKFWTYSGSMFFTAEDDKGAEYDWNCVGALFFFWTYMHGRAVVPSSSSSRPRIGVVFSDDTTKYPANGEQNGLYYELYGKLFDEMVYQSAKIQTTYYTGTGVYGEKNKNSITFDFVPKAVFITVAEGATTISNSAYGISCIFINPSTVGVIRYSTNTPHIINLSWSDKTLTWYSTNSYPEAQLNASGVTYRVVAVS